MASKFDAIVDQIKDSTLKAMARNGASTSDLLFRINRKNNHDLDLIRQLDRSMTTRNRANAPRTRPDHGESGSYGGMGARARRNGGQDGLEYDHIPSQAALIRALETRLNRRLSDWERNAVSRDASAVAITDVQHRNGRTWGGQNTPAQIDRDAADLNAAMERDLAAHAQTLAADGFSGNEIDEILDGIRELNADRGWNQ